MRNKSRLIAFTPALEEMIEMIQRQKGFLNFQDVVRAGVINLYDDTFPAYKNVTLRGADSEEDVVKRATLKARTKQIMEEKEEELKNEAKHNICKRVLNGEIINGETCRYTQYTIKDDNIIEIPLSQVNEAIAENTMFIPSREAVFKARKSVKKMFIKE